MKNILNALKLSRVSKTYGLKRVVDNANFLVRKGTIHGFVGPNGSGKTTTMHMIVKLIEMDLGSKIWVFNESLEESLYTNRYIGFAPSETEIMKEFEVEDIIVSYNTLRGLEKKFILEKIDKSPISKFRYQIFKSLSTGWRKIVQLFNISLSKPSIFLLDEPFNGLDPLMRNHLFNSLIELKKNKKTILLSTHILSDLQKLADDLTIIEAGRIIYSGPKTQNIEKTYSELFIHSEKEQKENNPLFDNPFSFFS